MRIIKRDLWLGSPKKSQSEHTNVDDKRKYEDGHEEGIRDHDDHDYFNGYFFEWQPGR